MIIGICGYTLENDDLFQNGYEQNIIFFCKFIEKYFSKEHTIIQITSANFLETNEKNRTFRDSGKRS